jgi:NIMA (never in mitosis gene a)-related kinase 1/4/5
MERRSHHTNEYSQQDRCSMEQPATAKDSFSLAKLPIHSRKYRTIDKLGEGGFGQVYRVEDRVRKVHYAQKRIVLRETNRKRALEEAKRLQKVKHENIVGYHECHLYKGGATIAVCIVMEFCPNGSLDSYVRKVIGISEQQVINWFTEIARGIKVTSLQCV